MWLPVASESGTLGPLGRTGSMSGVPEGGRGWAICECTP